MLRFHEPGFVPFSNRNFVEIGTQTAHECNSRLLRMKWGWEGIAFDDDNENQHIKLFRAKVGPWNINSIFDATKVTDDRLHIPFGSTEESV